MRIFLEVPLFIRAYPYIVAALVVVMIALYVSTLLKKARQKRADDRSPRQSEEVTVKAKREHIAGTGGRYGRTLTQYFATFEDSSGKRMELSLSGEEYGMLSEGDRGTLTFQGTRFLGFERQI